MSLKRLVVSSVCLALGLGLIVTATGKSPGKKPAIFKVGNSGPWCTAFAISNTTAVTAAHCIDDPLTAQMGVIKIYDVDNTEVGVGGVRISKHPALDIASVTGDFKNYEHLPVATDQYELSPNDVYESCGFPLMVNKLICSKVHLKTIISIEGLTAVAGDGYMVYGMSGGPLFNKTKNMVVALNTGLIDRELLFSPFIRIEESVKVPQFGIFFRMHPNFRYGPVPESLRHLVDTTDMIGVQ